MELLNGRKLAAAIGKSEWWICQAKKAGLRFYCGVITLEEAVEWMRENPDFIAADQVARPGRSGRGRPRKKRPGMHAWAAGFS